MRRKLKLLIAVSFSISAIGLSPISATENTIDLNKPGRFGLGICKTDSQLDCIEPTVTVTHKDGTSSTAKFLSSSSELPYVALEEKGPEIFHTFNVRSGTSSGIFRQFAVRAGLNTPSSKPFGLMGLRVTSNTKLNSDDCDESLRKLCKRFTLDPEDSFKFVLRTQKMPVQGIKATAANGDMLRENYSTGERWILTGSQTLPGWNPGLSWEFGPIIADAEDSIRKDVQCAGTGVVFTSSNAVTGGTPSWDKRRDSLNFGIQGPHFDANGDLFRGFFKARIPKKWLDCAYPENSLSMASEVVVSITYDDGSTQVATSSTRVTNELIYINVPVLYFSSPTIRVTNASLAKPAPTPKVVNCIKGKVKKTFKASKCASGWKLVS
jgi:hypothetical protein